VLSRKRKGFREMPYLERKESEFVTLRGEDSKDAEKEEGIKKAERVGGGSRRAATKGRGVFPSWRKEDARILHREGKSGNSSRKEKTAAMWKNRLGRLFTALP